MKIPDLLVNAVTRFPGRRCVVEGDRALSFTAVDARADAVAAALADAGLRRGDRAALLALNELEYLEIQLGAIRAGVILVTLNYRLTLPELAYIVDESTPGLLIHGPGYVEHARALDVGQTWHLGTDGAGDAYDEVISCRTSRRGPRQFDADQIATLLYTSGTTGRPKGAMLSVGAIWARATMFGLEVGMVPSDVFLQALPMFHMAAHLGYGFTYRGATNVFIRAFDAAEVVRLVDVHGVTHVLLVPTMINLVAQDPMLEHARLDSLRTVLYGASPISPEVLRRAMGALGCDFTQFFGMTETAGTSMLRAADHDPRRHPDLLASAGTDSVSMETRIVDDEDRDLPAGEVGEILSRGPCLMHGYWNQPEETERTLRGGWMHTGDLGYRSQEGYLFVTDRLGDKIVTGGENVYPREVEDVIYESADVLEAAVIGVPDECWGEHVHAVVVPRAGATTSSDELIEHCRVRLAGYKVPRSVEFVDELPKNPTGKILKRLLRDRYWPDGERHIG